MKAGQCSLGSCDPSKWIQESVEHTWKKLLHLLTALWRFLRPPRDCQSVMSALRQLHAQNMKSAPRNVLRLSLVRRGGHAEAQRLQDYT